VKRYAGILLALALLAATPDFAAPALPVTTTYFGTAVVDPYRYFERGGAQYDAWKARQLQATEAMLTLARSRAPQFVAAQSTTARITDLALAGQSVFYVRHTASNDALTTCNVLACHPRTIVLAATYGAPKSTFLGAFAASSDGKIVALHVYVGRTVSDIHVLRVADGRDVEAPLHNTVFDYIGFFPDNRRLVYARAAAGANAELAARSYDYEHRIGTAQRSDRVIFGPGVSNRVRVADRSFAFVDPRAPQAVAEVRDFSAVGSRFYTAPLNSIGRPDTPWRPLGDARAQFTDYTVHGTTIDLITHAGAPNYAVVRASLTGVFVPRIVLPASNDTVVSGTLDNIPKAGIFALNAARDADYVQLLKNGHAQMVRIPYAPGARPQPVGLPLPEGSILEAAADPARDGLLVQMTSWTDPGDVYRLQNEAIANDVFKPLAIVDTTGVGNRVATTLTATASDGTRIPIELIGDTSPAYSPRPTILLSAGAFGFSITPDYRIIPQAWLDAGGCVAIAHIRGGGEFGEAWHQAGMGARKSNSWSDIIAVANVLVSQHVVTPGQLDLEGTMQSYLGGTASSIAIGRAIEERPDLFSAAVIDAPSFDMLRAETIPFGRQSVPEFGTVANRNGFDALLAMSPYAHVRDGVDYPPILVRSFEHAYAVGADWQAAKMVARWQAATKRPDSAYLDIVGSASDDARTAADLRTDMLAFFSYENARATAKP
jgi:prolyl oligopeptidase